MKFAACVLALAAVHRGAQAFAPANTFAARSIIAAPESPTALDFRRRNKKRGPKTFKPSNGRAKSGSKSITEPEVRALFELWNNALATGDSRIVAKRYAKQAVLLPTVSNVPRTDYSLIKDYL